jgi:hypothetical protein
VYSNGFFCEFKEVHKIILLLIYNCGIIRRKKDHERTPSSIITTIMDSNVHVIYFFKTPTINNHHERTFSSITTTIVDSNVHVIYFFKTPIVNSHHYSILLCHLS